MYVCAGSVAPAIIVVSIGHLPSFERRREPLSRLLPPMFYAALRVAMSMTFATFTGAMACGFLLLHVQRNAPHASALLRRFNFASEETISHFMISPVLVPPDVSKFVVSQRYLKTVCGFTETIRCWPVQPRLIRELNCLACDLDHFADVHHAGRWF